MFRLLCTLVLAWNFSSAAIAQHQAFHSVLDRQYLIDMGVNRPADILELIDGWSSYSIDGFTRKASPNGYDGYGKQRWMLFVDGRRVETGALEVINLNILPISIQDIDSVEVFNTPVSINGTFADKGAIHIHTQKVESGIDLGGSIYTGNEVNDPGPFLYTEFATPNIDRIGTDGSGFLRFGSNGFYAGVSVNYREHHATDSHISYRTRNLHDNNNHSPRVMVNAGSIRFGKTTDNQSTDISLSRSKNSDFPYIAQHGAEIPMRQEYTSVSYRGSYKLNSSFGISLSASYTEDHILDRFNYRGWFPDLKQDYIRGNAAFNFTAGNWLTTMGGGVDYLLARPNVDVLISDRYRVYRGFINTGRSSTSGSIRTSVDVSSVAGLILPKIAFKSSRRFDAGRFDFNLAYTTRSIYEEHSLYYWMHMGYSDFVRLGPNPTNFDDIEKSTQISADVALGFDLSPSVNLTFITGFRNDRGSWLPIQDVDYIADEVRFAGDIRLVPDIGGNRVLAGFRINQKNTKLTQEVGYTLKTQVTGGDIFKETGREIPLHTAFYRIRYTPFHSFNLSASFRYNSATEWRMFYTNTAGTIYYNSPVVPNQFQLGLYARKSILDDRLYVAIGVENALNRALQEWPAGEVSDMTFHISAGVALKGSNRIRYSQNPFERPLY